MLYYFINLLLQGSNYLFIYLLKNYGLDRNIFN